MTSLHAPRAVFGRSLIDHPLPWLLALCVAHVAVRVALSQGLKWDEAEQILWSQHLQWGYGEQPPLYTWLQWGVIQVLGPSVLALSLLKHSLLALTYVFMWLAGRELLGPRGAWWAAASMMLLPELGWYSIRDHTHTVLITTMTCAAWWLLLRIVRRPRPRQVDFVWLGLACGLGMLSKYNFALGAFAMLLAALLVPETRRALLSRGWWWTLVVGALLVFPHAVWMMSHLDEATARTINRMELRPEHAAGAGLSSLLIVYVGVLGFWVLLALWAFRGAWWRGAAVSAAWAPSLFRRYLALVTLALIGLVLLVGVTQFRGRWVMPFLCVAPLAAFAARPELQDHPRAGRYTGAVVVVAVVILIAAGVWPWLGGLRGRPGELNQPVKELEAALRAAGYHGQGHIIAADPMLAGMLRTRFPQAVAAVCVDHVSSCVAAQIDSARHAGTGWLLVSYDDRVEPGWWEQARLALPPPRGGGVGEKEEVQLIELPFRMARTSTPPARYRFIWRPPAPEAAQ